MSTSPLRHAPSRRRLPRRHRPGHFNHLNRLTRVLLLGSVGWLGAQTSLLAADRTWTGGGDGALWSNAGNWNAMPVTTGADSLLFGSAGAGTLTNDFENASFGRINFLAGAGAFTLQGNRVTIGTDGLINQSSVTQTMDLGLTLGAATGQFSAWTGDLVVNGTINGTGRVVITSNTSGTVYLNGANTDFTGGVAVNSKLHLGDANALGNRTLVISSGSVITFEAGIGTFYTGGLEGSGGPLVLEDEAGEGVTLYLRTGNGNTARGNVMSGKGGLVLDAGSSSKQLLSAANTYTGGTWIKSGTLELNGGAGNISGPLTIDDGELSIQRANRDKTVTLTALNGTGGRITANTGTGTAHLRLNSTGTDRYSGNLQNGDGDGGGTLAFAKLGSGTFTFAGEGTYTGATSVDAGVYRLEGSLTSTLVTVKSGATLEGAGGVIGETLTLNDGSSLLFHLTPGQTEPLLTVGSISFDSTVDDPAVDLKLVLGGVIAAGTEIQLLDFAGGMDGSFATINGGEIPLDGLLSLTYGVQDYLFQYQESATGISIVAIPEPQSVTMLLLGVGAVLGSYWTRRRSGARLANGND